MSTKVKQTNLERFRNTWSYKHLLEKHSLQEVGIWRVRGEDPNCDFGGHHYQPDLGTFEGKLEDIIAYAVDLPSFWQWGAGGDITKISAPMKIDADSVHKRAEAERLVRELEELLKQAKQQLEAL
jgi:hypothetical protein